MFDKIKDWFKEEYELTVWFTVEEIYDGNGILSVRKKSEKVFLLSKVDKLTQKHIIGKDPSGKKIVIKTDLPFDYTLLKTK